MKNKINKLISVVVAISIIMMIFASNITYASFAEYDDETADKQANEDLKEQEAIDKENAGKSSNNYLEQLSVDGYELTPKFDKQTINYSIEEEITDGEIEINAKPADERATISGAGKVKLQSGENNLKIDVVAENGTTRTYFIKVSKKITNLSLTQLKLTAVDNETNEEVQLSPKFDKEIFEYNCIVYNNITKINVEALASEEADIEIAGNENLKVGNNTITITVKSKEDESEAVYKINVVREESKEVSNVATEDKQNNIIPIIVLLVVVAIIIILLSKKPRKSKH